MEKCKITWLKREQKTSANGKPYTRLALKTDKFGEEFLSGFGNRDNENWAVGSEVDLIVKKVEKDGKTYLNFDTPKKEDKSLKELNDIAIKVAIIQNDVKRIINHLTGEDRLDRTSDNTPIPDFNPPEDF